MKRSRRLHILFTVLFFLLLWGKVIGQNGDYGNSISSAEKQFITEQLIEQYWGNSTSVYESDIPEAFQQSRAVILSQTVRREFYRNSRNFLRTINLDHKIVYLQDKEGVAEHSVFGFEKISSPFAFDVTAVKVIKPDGREYIVDMDSATVTRNERGVSVERFIIPGLEVGDILDYFYYLEFRVLFPQQYTRIFDPVYWLPQGKYPVLHCDLEFIVGPSAFLNASSFELPPFRKANYKIDNKTFSRYELSIDTLPAVQLDRPYYHPFRELPHLRYQVFISPYSGNTGIVYNLGGSLKLNTEIQRSRLQDYLVFTLKSGREYRPQYKSFAKYLRQTAGKPRKLPADRLAEAYYLWEQDRLELSRLLGRPQAPDEPAHVSKTHYIFNKLNVEHDILLAFDRSLTDIDHFLLTDEISPMLRIFGQDTMLLAIPAEGRAPGMVPPLLEATVGYAFDPGTLELTEAQLPASRPEDNVILAEITVTPDLNGHGTIQKSYRVTGHDKTEWQQQVVNTARQFLEEGAAGYRDMFHYGERKSKSSREKAGKLELRMADRENEIEAAARRKIGAGNQDVEGVVWRLNAAGRMELRDSLSWELEYTLPEMAARVGPDYLLSLRSLVTSPGIDRQSIADRRANLYFDYPYSRFWIVRLETPPGFQIGVPEDIEVELSNEAGTVKSRVLYLEDRVDIHIEFVQSSRMLSAVRSDQLLDLVDAYARVLEKRILYRNDR